MCRLAAEPEPWLTASRIEVDRKGPSYTVDTLRALRSESPGDDFLVILGGDAAAELASWREPEQVLSLAAVAVAERDDARKQQVVSALGNLRGSNRVAFFSMPRIEISSTMVRERSAASRPIRYLVPEAVGSYIEETGLYGAGAALERAGQRA
jgi:nicotinate-nucleotide adenylyltransferase